MGLQTNRYEHRDLDEFALDAPGYALEIRQLDPGEFASRMAFVSSPRVQVAWASFERSLEIQGTTPLGMRTFKYAVNDELAWTWRGRFARGNDFLVYPRGARIDVLIPAGWSAFAISIEEEYLARVLAEAGLTEADLASVEQLRTDPGGMDALRLLSTRLLADPDGPDAVRIIEQEIPRALMERVAAAHLCERIPASPRSNVVLAAREYMIEHAREAPTIKAVLEVVGASERTLRRAFNEHVGVSPKAYLLAQRLNGVRTELRESGGPDTRVTDVAGRWGFRHLGQFAAQYRRQFGELPSHTGRE